jgi:hypothetical protein
MDKKQELIERITKMLEPYEKIDGYAFSINLYIDRIKEEFKLSDTINISYNAPIGVTPYNHFLH